MLFVDISPSGAICSTTSDIGFLAFCQGRLKNIDSAPWKEGPLLLGRFLPMRGWFGEVGVVSKDGILCMFFFLEQH